jgi:hypothetical protein
MRRGSVAGILAVLASVAWAQAEEPWSWLATIADGTTAPLDFNEYALLEVAPNLLMLVFDMLGSGSSRVNSINLVRIEVAG